jgi:hypothetical protein
MDTMLTIAVHTRYIRSRAGRGGLASGLAAGESCWARVFALASASWLMLLVLWKNSASVRKPPSREDARKVRERAHARSTPPKGRGE